VEFQNENRAAVIAGTKLVLAILAGEEPLLTEGWSLGEPDWDNSYQEETYLAFAHPNARVVQDVQRIERTLNPTDEFAPNMDLQFLMVLRPQS